MEKHEVRILVVDDEQGILESLETHLALSGYQVETAAAAQEALAAHEAQRFDIVLTDINMPHMDGIELLEKIKEMHGETIVIMITAYSTMMRVVRSRIYGAADYVLKPFEDLSEVDEVIGRAHRQIDRWAAVLEKTPSTKKKAS